MNIIVFDGYLYGLSKNGVIYGLCNEHFSVNYWIWKKINWCFIKNIYHLSSTLNGSHLLIQTKNKSYLYDRNHQYEKIKTKYKRIYGKDINCYLEIDEKYNQCHLYFNNKLDKTMKHIKNAMLDHQNNIHFIKENDKYINVKLINYEPYYIK